MKYIVHMVVETSHKLKPKHLYDEVDTFLEDQDLGRIRFFTKCELDLDDLRYRPLEFIEHAMREALEGNTKLLEEALVMVEGLYENEEHPDDRHNPAVMFEGEDEDE